MLVILRNIFTSRKLVFILLIYELLLASRFHDAPVVINSLHSTDPSQGTLYLNVDRTSSFYHYNESNNILSVV